MASRRHRPAADDQVLDLDAGSGGKEGKQAVALPQEQARVRQQDREGLRDLQRMTLRMGLSPAQLRRELIYPVAQVQALRHPRAQRTLPEPDALRRPLSGRQKDQRSRAKTAARSSMPITALRAQHDLLTKPQRWHHLNDQLSAHTGDLQELGAADQRRIRAIDRSIADAERTNDRGHVVYINAAMPPEVNRYTVQAYLQANLAPGQRISFDRYSVATHQMHETVNLQNPDAPSPVLEIQTRRGAYLGQSGSGSHTDHLLPRGLELEVVSIHQGSFTDASGRRHHRPVIQLRDVTDTPPEGEDHA